MIVKELIDLLNKENPNANVFLYVNEDWQALKHIKKGEDNIDDNELYTKGASFTEVQTFDDRLKNYIVLCDY